MFELNFVDHTSHISGNPSSIQLPASDFAYIHFFRFLFSLCVLSNMENKTGKALLDRTFDFSSRSLKLCNSLGRGSGITVIKNQLLRASTSVGANYRAAKRARSRKDFVSKLAVVEEEADECVYWFSMLEEAGVNGAEITWLKREADEIVAIMVASRKTAARKLEE